MDDLVRGPDGRSVGHIKAVSNGWQVYIYFGNSQKLLVDPETGKSDFPQLSTAAKVLARHIEVLRLVQGELEKRGTG